MSTHYRYTLGIESSCDESAVAIYSKSKGLITHQLHSQIAAHKDYGGVVPEIASREHILYITPLIQKALQESALNISDISGIAYTQGPGLAGALLVGSAIAKSLAFALKIPALGINHMEGHLLAPLLEKNKPNFPFICLLISGGHTMLVEAKKMGSYRILGESLDDAVGEAFDKTAKLLGLGYPGGSALSKLARGGTENAFKFPRPLIHKKTLDFSFSGLKTFARNTLEKYPKRICDIACAFEAAATDVLVAKCERAMKQSQLSTLVVAGGVSANQTLRQKVNQMAEKIRVQVFYPRSQFCTDNAAMIALAGHLRLTSGEKDRHQIIDIKPRWSLANLH